MWFSPFGQGLPHFTMISWFPCFISPKKMWLLFHVSAKIPWFFNLFPITKKKIGTQVYKPMLGCIGEFPTVAVGGVLRSLGFIFMSMAKTPVTPLGPLWDDRSGFTMEHQQQIDGVCQPTIKMVFSNFIAVIYIYIII